VSQEGSGCERRLEGFKSLSGGWSPGQRLGLITEEVGEWTGDGIVALDETSIEVCKPQESL